MKYSTIFLLIAIVVSCTKDISNQFIQPPKYKGENVSEVFPYVKYTSVRTLEYNKSDTFGIFGRKIPVNNIGLFMDSLQNKFWEETEYESLKTLHMKIIEKYQIVYSYSNKILFIQLTLIKKSQHQMLNFLK